MQRSRGFRSKSRRKMTKVVREVGLTQLPTDFKNLKKET